jgi:hypothetical protein
MKCITGAMLEASQPQPNIPKSHADTTSDWSVTLATSYTNAMVSYPIHLEYTSPKKPGTQQKQKEVREMGRS